MVDKEILPKDAFCPDTFVLIIFSDTLPKDAFDTIMYAVDPIYNELFIDMLLTDMFVKDAFPFATKVPYGTLLIVLN